MELSQRLKKFVTEYRARCKKSDDERDKDLPHDIPEVERIDDLSYGSDKWHTLDVYLPKKTDEPFPVIINIHGGGWVYGTKETYQYYGMNLAKHVLPSLTLTTALPQKTPNFLMNWTISTATCTGLMITQKNIV